MLHRIRRIRDLFIPGVFGLLVLITLICVLAGCSSSAGATVDGATASAVDTPHSQCWSVPTPTTDVT